MRLSEQQSDFMWMVYELLGFVRQIFFNPADHFIKDKYLKVTSWTRTPEEQKEFVDEGFSWTLNSKHLSGLAVDFMIIEKGQTVFESAIYGMMGTYWEDMGGIWGGNWKKRDVFHFEYNLKKRQELLKKDESDPFNY